MENIAKLRQYNISEYSGPIAERPTSLPFGDYYFAEDIGILYKYNYENQPIAIGGASSSFLKVSKFSDLPSSGTEGDVAYVLTKEGTAWLPGSMGGSYRPAGWYAVINGDWVSDSRFISDQLNTNDALIAQNTLDIYDLQQNGGGSGASLSDNPFDVNWMGDQQGATKNTLYNKLSEIDNNLDNKSEIGHTHNKEDIIDFSELDYATAAEGNLASTALQPGDDISQLFNDEIYLQPGDPISAFENDVNYIIGKNVDNYRSDFSNLDGFIYSGLTLNESPKIYRSGDDGVIGTAQNVTNLEIDWNNRFNLNYI
jgi:hypothetical protein